MERRLASPDSIDAASLEPVGVAGISVVFSASWLKLLCARAISLMSSGRGGCDIRRVEGAFSLSGSITFFINDAAFGSGVLLLASSRGLASGSTLVGGRDGCSVVAPDLSTILPFTLAAASLKFSVDCFVAGILANSATSLAAG